MGNYNTNLPDSNIINSWKKTGVDLVFYAAEENQAINPTTVVTELAKKAFNIEPQEKEVRDLISNLYPSKDNKNYMSKVVYIETVKQKVNDIAQLKEEYRDQISQNIESIIALRQKKEEIRYAGLLGKVRWIFAVIGQAFRSHGFQTKAQWEQIELAKFKSSLNEAVKVSHLNDPKEEVPNSTNPIKVLAERPFFKSALENAKNHFLQVNILANNGRIYDSDHQISILRQLNTAVYHLASTCLNACDDKLDIKSIKNEVQEVFQLVSKLKEKGYVAFDVLMYVKFLGFIANKDPESELFQEMQPLISLCESLNLTDHPNVNYPYEVFNSIKGATPNFFTEDEYDEFYNSLIKQALDGPSPKFDNEIFRLLNSWAQCKSTLSDLKNEKK